VTLGKLNLIRHWVWKATQEAIERREPLSPWPRARQLRLL
jgi:hypothetical protein